MYLLNNMAKALFLVESDKIRNFSFSEPAGELDRVKRRTRRVTRNVR
jgi:hypothetical protein